MGLGAKPLVVIILRHGLLDYTRDDIYDGLRAFGCLDDDVYHIRACKSRLGGHRVQIWYESFLFTMLIS